MIEDYRSAQRAGQRAYRANVARGQSPYLAVLDDILTDVDIVAQEPLGWWTSRPRASWYQDRRTPHRLCLQFHASSRRRHRVCSQVVEPL